jgi:hypothetical protein
MFFQEAKKLDAIATYMEVPHPLNLYESTTIKESISSISLSPLLSRSLACEIAQTHSGSQIAWKKVYYIHKF